MSNLAHGVRPELLDAIRVWGWDYIRRSGPLFRWGIRTDALPHYNRHAEENSLPTCKVGEFRKALVITDLLERLP